MGSKTQHGFTLVELMVALVIGFLIILGAGQLYLTVFKNFKQVAMLGEKQAVLNFLADTLVRDIRRAELIAPKDNGVMLQIEDKYILYALGDSTAESVGEDGRSIMLESEGQPLVNGLIDADKAFEVKAIGGGLYKIIVKLRSVRGSDVNPEVFTFHAMNRTEAFNPDEGSSDP